MEKKVKIPFNPELPGRLLLKNGKWGVILAHGERSGLDSGILPSLSKKLAEKNISSIRFEFPFRIIGKRKIDEVSVLDESYLAVWNWVSDNYPQYSWSLGGHDIGAETSIRVSGLVMTSDGSIPPVICLNYPLYPPNRPEEVEASTLGAVMGDILFIQAENSNKGNYDRLKNQVGMMVGHAVVNKIGKADHFFNVDNKSFDRVAYWISNDIERFFKNIS